MREARTLRLLLDDDTAPVLVFPTTTMVICLILFPQAPTESMFY
jgi:hypothetical protein